MFGLSFTELLIITAVALIAIGPKKLPDVARAVGRGLGEFKSALDEMRDSVIKEVKKPIDETRSDYIESLLEARKSAEHKGAPPYVETNLGPAGDTHTPMADEMAEDQMINEAAEVEREIAAIKEEEAQTQKEDLSAIKPMPPPMRENYGYDDDEIDPSVDMGPGDGESDKS